MLNKIVAIHQPNFLPWQGYFHKIMQADVFVFLDNVDIEIGSSKAITNRTKIKSVSGEQWLTIPLKKSDTKVINKLNYLETNWRDKVIKTIQMNYAKAPFFKEIFPLLEEIIFYPTNNIATYNINGITKVCTHLGIHNKQFILASEMNLIGQERNDRIIEICQKANSNQYFSGNGGKKYHDENYFIAKGINITYTNFTQKPYSQLYGEFIPGLSIIDALFNHNIKML